MPYCPGCSKHYRFLEEGERCDPCLETPSHAKARDEWPNCVDCGRRYEFLTVPQCGKCKDRADTNAMPPPGLARDSSSDSQTVTRELQQAMANPVNPRTHGTSQGTYSNPFQSQSIQDQNDPRYHNAQALFKDFQNGFTNAVQRAAPQMKIAKPKFRGAETGPPTRPVPKIHVVIRKIVNRNRKNLTTPFDPQLISYEETRLWTSIEDNILTWLDGIYSSEHCHRIRSKDEFSLAYNHGKVALLPISREEGTTLKDLWKASTQQPGLLVQTKHMASMTLELDAKVKYPRKDLDENDSEYSSKSKSKRKVGEYRTSSIVQTSKKYKTGYSGAHSYATNITSMASAKPSADQECFIVKKLTVSFVGSPPNIEAVWEETDNDFSIVIDKTKFSSGKTKNAFKLRFTTFAAKYFAAKSFYDIGNYGVPTEEENMRHLQQELIRQLTIKDAVSNFLKVAQEFNIAVHDLQVADAFILQVSEGPDTGRCWLVDRLLDYRKMRKFSGSDNAGDNTDFAGMTCDAFAHFTLVSSNLDFVPVDIQGIDTQVFRDSIPAANTITLFDIMAHSKLGTMGLGDNGIDGMKQFCKQHECNSICKKFKLPPTSDLINEIDNIDDDMDHNDILHYVNDYHYDPPHHQEPKEGNNGEEEEEVDDNGEENGDRDRDEEEDSNVDTDKGYKDD